MDKMFWEEVKAVWFLENGQKSFKSTDEREEVPFDQVDFDATFDAFFAGNDVQLNSSGYSERKVPGRESPDREISEQKLSDLQPETEETPKRKLDVDRFEGLLEKRTIPDYIEACKMLKDCKLPQDMDLVYEKLMAQMQLLQGTITKFSSVYQADMTQFYECYIPETLQLTSSYIEYLNMGIREKILQETEKEVMNALDKLLVSVDEKKEEICRFASIEIKARAKALESLMSQDGYVDPGFKL